MIVLAVTGEGLPVALSPAADIDLEVGEALVAFGFHFESLASGIDRTAAPPVAVPVDFSSTIDSARIRPGLVLNGFVETGFHGGPVVTRRGELVGMIREHQQSRPELVAHPAAAIIEIMTTRVEPPRLGWKHVGGGTWEIDLWTIVHDPLRRVVSMKTLVAFSPEELPREKNADGTYARLRSVAKEVETTSKPYKDNRGLSARSRFPIEPSGPRRAYVTLQVEYVTTTGDRGYSMPFSTRNRSAGQ
jgi:hypothetical protein